MGIYERRHDPLADRGEPFRYMPSASGAPAGCSSGGGAQAMEPKFEPSLHPLVVQDVALQEAQLPRSPDSSDQEPARPGEKIQRRLAQNREAARKSRLRKKAYIQILESSRIKLAHMEQELNRARQQVVYAGGRREQQQQQPGWSWITSILQSRCCSVRDGVHALGGGAGEADRRAQDGAAAAGHAGAPAPRSRRGRARALRPAFPGQVRRRKVRRLLRHVRRVEARRRALFPLDRRLPPLRPPQGPGAAAGAADGGAGGGGGPAAADGAAGGGRAVAGHGEAPAIACRVPAAVDGGTRRLGRLYVVGWHRVYAARMASAMGRLDELAVFVEQADHLRQQTLRNMYRILTAAQAARGLLALGDYCQRLRALSSMWAVRPPEPA